MTFFKFLTVWFITGPVVISINGEIFTSMVNVKQAIDSERKLIYHLKSYIEQETERLRDIQR